MNLLPQPAHSARRAFSLARVSLRSCAVLKVDATRLPLKRFLLPVAFFLCQKNWTEGASQKLMFVTHTGPVLATAKMLAPVSSHLQPFQFVSLHQNDKRKLGEAIRTCLEPDDSRTQWIEKYQSGGRET